MMNKSESIKELASAFAKAQAAIEKAAKDKNNPHFRSKYADLGNVVDAIKPALEDNGLSFVQISHDAEGAAKIETIVMHASGEWLSCGVVSVPVNKNDAQGFGSAMTYARRYSLQAAFGVAPEDDDGNAAAAAAEAKQKAMAKAAPKAKAAFRLEDTLIAIREAEDLRVLTRLYHSAENDGATPEQMAEVKEACAKRRAELEDMATQG
ncbi:ERF family protein [Cupriavidus gilardii]|uniref:ERF family protein n=1 Tax=Cupriavidus gilardii TaxID=82541 RepID=UPI002B2BBB27|nr:ERF family protein [Cupriavidus gilardii]